MMFKNKRQKNQGFFSCNFVPKNRKGSKKFPLFRILPNSNKGISIMIGYILLITTTIVISAIVYQWVQTYVPKDPIGCPDGVSFFVKESIYNCQSNNLNLTLKNNGKFNIGGYLIFATTSPNQKLASEDLSSYNPLGVGKGGAVLFATLSNSMKPNKEITNVFDLSSSNLGQIYSVEITPILHQENKRVNCGDSKIREALTCDVPGSDSGGGDGEEAVCGNGIIEIGEQCDDGNTANNDGCSGTCQNEAVECNDGIDNDGDTFVDYPNDAGCDNSLDDDESTPTSITFVGSAGSSGTSVTLDIGTANTNRLVVIIAGDESDGDTLTGVTVDGNNCNFVVYADNPKGVGNHQEMWYCDEDDLGSSSGSVAVSISGGNSGWATHAHLYTGVDQSGFKDSGTDDTSIDTTITITGIDVSANGLVVMGAGDGSSGSFNDGGWTSPLTERTDGPDPSSAVLATASGIETTAQSSKTYVATASVNFNRGSGTVGVWDVAT